MKFDLSKVKFITIRERERESKSNNVNLSMCVSFLVLTNLTSPIE